MVLAIIAGVAVFILWRMLSRNLDARQRTKNAEMDRAWKDERLSDESIAAVQARFEEIIDIGGDLCVRRRDAYIYRQLMKRWFLELSSKHRFDDGMSKKIKTAWLEYMETLQEAPGEAFCYNEAKDETKRNEHNKTLSSLRDKYQAVENAFAHAVGGSAISELKKVREADVFAFDEAGREPLAPDGFWYISGRLEKRAKPQSSAS